MTQSSVVALARRLLKDTFSTPRWATGTLNDYVDAGEQEIYRLRPDLFMTDFETIGSISVVTLNSTTGDRYESALAYYTAYRALLEDNADTANAQEAQKFLALFERAL